MGKVSKGITCSVVGCDKPAVRSISQEKAQVIKLTVGSERRVYVCSDHWKEVKKKFKKDKRIEKWRWTSS